MSFPLIRKLLLFIIIPLGMFFSFQPFNMWFLFIPAYALLIYLLSDMTGRRRLLFAWLSHTVFFFVSMHWIMMINVHFPGITRILIALGLVLLSGALALIWTVPIMLVNLRTRSIYLLPVFFASMEFLTSIENNTAFMWLSPSQTMLSMPVLAQTADIGGMYIVSAAVLMFSVLIMRACTQNRKRMIYNIAALLGLLVIVIIYGSIRMNQEYRGKTISIAIVQPNVPASVKEQFYDGTQHRIRILRSYLDQLKSENVQLAVFPETSAPVYLQRKTDFSKYIQSFADSTGIDILMGSLRVKYDREKKRFDYYNSAYLFNEKGQFIYNKIRPLGFAERMPYDDRWRFLRNIPLGQGDLTPGDEYVIFETDSIPYASYICFESVFATIGAEFTRRGAQFLVNISEDAWFVRSVGARQHFYAGLFRAIENRRYLIRCSNPGISAVIAPTGIIEKKLKLQDEGVITAEIMAIDDLTFYTRFDNILPKLFVIIMLAYAIYILIRRINERCKGKNSAQPHRISACGNSKNSTV